MSGVVGIDARMMEHSGIGTYLRHLAQGLENGAGGKLRYAYYGDPAMISRHLPGVPDDALRRFDAPIYSVREHWEYALLRRRWDLWHCPHYAVPFIKKGKLVSTVHDLIHLVFQGRFFNAVQGLYARQCLTWVRGHADAVIAVSQSTKKDLVEMAGIAPEKITVIYEGVSPEFRPLDEAKLQVLKQKYRLDEDFILYVGNIKPHKNVGQLARVFRGLKAQKKIGGNLVLVGRPDPEHLSKDQDLRAAASDPSVRFVKDVPWEDLPGLYNLARAVILPSLYEGFGLVVLEAMACGTPVAVSNRASLPEIAGDAAEIFDPESDAELGRALERITQDVARREAFAALGRKRAEQFRWDRMARETVHVYEGVLGA